MIQFFSEGRKVTKNRSFILLIALIFAAMAVTPVGLAADEEGCGCCFPLDDDAFERDEYYYSETIPDDYEISKPLYNSDDFGSALYEAGDSPSLYLLMQRYPNGKYWNYGNLDGYSDTPCQRHRGTVLSSCNDFKKSTQCLGFARKLGWDAYGTDSKYDWQTSSSQSYIPYLKPGDIIRYRSNGHSIFVTDVFEDYILVGECNWDNCCGISWGRRVNKSDLDITTVYIAPYALPGGTVLGSPSPDPPDCGCSYDCAGTYTTKGVTDNLRIRSGHGTSYSAIGRIPANAVFTVTRGNGVWAHVTYNGISGYCSMEYIMRLDGCNHQWLSIETKPAGCSEDGYTLYQCFKCGELKREVIVSTGHSFGEKHFDNAYPYNEYEICSACGGRFYTGKSCSEILNKIYDHIAGTALLPEEKLSEYDAFINDGVIDIRDFNAFYSKIDD